MFCRTRYVRCGHKGNHTTAQDDSDKRLRKAGCTSKRKGKREAPAGTAESAVQDMEATTRKADAVSGCALDADKLGAGLSELMHTVDLIYAWLFDKLFNKDKRARDNQG